MNTKKQVAIYQMENDLHTDKYIQTKTNTESIDWMQLHPINSRWVCILYPVCCIYLLCVSLPVSKCCAAFASGNSRTFGFDDMAPSGVDI